MTRRPTFGTMLAVVPVGFLLGCAAPQPTGTPVRADVPAATPPALPLGEWTGIGRYCRVENMAAVATQPVEPKVRAGLYPTSLKIERTTLAGEPVLCIDILSLSEMNGPKDRTQILIYLDPEPVRAAGVPLQLYRVRQAGVSLEEGAAMQFQTGGAGIAVSLMRDADDTVLRIEGVSFRDCLRFRGTRVTKDGVYGDGGSLRIYWSETLERRR